MAGSYFIKKPLWRSYGVSHEISEFVINRFLSVPKFIFCEIPGVLLLYRLERNGFAHSGFFLPRRIFSCDGVIEDEEIR